MKVTELTRDELVTDEEVYQEYADVDFVKEDFFGNI